MGGDQATERTQQLFAAMWAIGHVVHLVNHTGGAFTTVTGTLTFLVALCAFQFRADRRWLIALAVCQLADVAWELPNAPDHWNLAAAANLGLLITWIVTRDAQQLVSRAGPMLRAVTVIAYAAAATAKWNTSFLDPAVSCGVELAHIATLTLSDMAPALDWGHIVFSLAAESLIALCLIIPRFRRAGALLGTSFHFLVSLSPAMLVADFTAILAALFALFLPLEHRDALAERMHAALARFSAVPTGQLVAFVLFTGGILGHFSSFASRATLWVAVTIYLAVLLRHLWTTRQPGGAAVKVWRPSPALFVTTTLVLALALSPYVGGRTTGVFTMFSNLRTEGAGTNHLFMPVIDIGDWQTNAVELEGSSSALITEWADSNLQLPAIDLARRLHVVPDLTVEATVDGESVSFGPNGAGADRPHWFVRLFTTFRAFAPSGANPCSG